MDELTPLMPLCMRRCHRDLRQHHHLPHAERVMYVLFLKCKLARSTPTPLEPASWVDIAHLCSCCCCCISAAGLSLEESLAFFLEEYRRGMSEAEVQVKRYAYTIRHLYGREGVGGRRSCLQGQSHPGFHTPGSRYAGRRVEAAPLSCRTVLDNYNCPLRSHDGPQLRALMEVRLCALSLLSGCFPLLGVGWGVMVQELLPPHGNMLAEAAVDDALALASRDQYQVRLQGRTGPCGSSRGTGFPQKLRFGCWLWQLGCRRVFHALAHEAPSLPPSGNTSCCVSSRLPMPSLHVGALGGSPLGLPSGPIGSPQDYFAEALTLWDPR